MLGPEEQVAANGDLSGEALFDDAAISALVEEYHAPPGFDARHAPWLREVQGLPARQKQPEASLLSPIRLRTDAPEEAALRIAEKVAGAAGLGELFEGALHAPT